MKSIAAFLAPVALLAAGNGDEGATADNTASQSALPDRAATVSVAPLRLEIGSGQTAATLRLRNPSTVKIGVQVRAFAWSQPDGEDAYAPTSDIVITPAIITIEPGEEQFFRVLRTGASGKGEKRYRVAIDQLPDPSAAKHGSATARLRFTVPLFLDRDTASAPQMAWAIGPDGLSARNSGGQTVRIMNLSARDAGGREVGVDRNGLRYLLGDSTIHWPLAGTCPTGPVKISVLVDGETVDAQAASRCG